MFRKKELHGGKKIDTNLIEQYLFNPFSRLWHGNTAGYKNNVLGRRQLRVAQNCFKQKRGKVLRDNEAASLEKQGYLFFNPNYPPNLLSKIHHQANTLFINPSESVATGRHAIKPSRSIPRPLKKIPEIKQLLTKEVINLVTHYYQSYFTVDMVRVWRNHSVSAEDAKQDNFSNLWHNDYDLITRLRYFVYLTDEVTEDTGALRFHSASRTRQILLSGYIRRDRILSFARNKLEDVNKVVFFKGNIGDACFMNPQLCFHRAGVPAPGKIRDIVQFTFMPSTISLKPNWEDDLLDDPELNMS